MEDKKVTMYFVRHGETYLNKYKRMQGWSDAPLTEEGEEVARKTGLLLRDIRFDAVYTSDLGRTIRTAHAIMESNRYRDTTPMIQTKLFRESFFGYYEGATQQESYATFAKAAELSPEEMFGSLTLPEFMQVIKNADPYHEAENYSELWARLWKGLEKVIEDSGEKEHAKVLICTHGNVIRNIFTRMDDRVSPAEEIRNAGVSILEYRNGSYKVKGFNLMDKIEDQEEEDV